MTAKHHTIFRKTLPVLIIIFAIAIFAGLTASRKKPSRIRPVFEGVSVKVTIAETDNRRVLIRGHGTVKPFREITLAAQVSGKVEWINPKLVAGGVFDEGEILLKIEQDDYILAVDQAKAVVAGAAYAFELEKANSSVALSEWEALQTSRDILSEKTGRSAKEPDALVLREPQLKLAEGNYASAQAAMKLAELQLKRTVLKAPFNCRIRSESVDRGQFISAGIVIANLFYTDMVEIEVGLPFSELLWMEVPGAEAAVKLSIGSGEIIWKGRVDRNLGVVDERERLAKVVVQVKDPFKSINESPLELNIGTFVEVEIQGKELTGIIPLPRHTLREGSTMWVMNENNTLDIRDVRYVRLTPREVFVKSGIFEGEKVVTSSISGASPGMKLRSTADRNNL